MKDLLLKIQAELKAVSGVRDRDIFILADTGIIPERAKFPCIGIKDGKLTRHEAMGGAVTLEMDVSIGIYGHLVRDDAEVLEVLELAGRVHDALGDNELAGYVRGVSPVAESPVQVLYKKGMDSLMLRKILSYEYEREVLNGI